MTAVYAQTAPEPTAPWAMPGTYTARLTVNGKTYEETFTLRMDPRVKTSVEALQQQHDLSGRCYMNRLKIKNLEAQIADLRNQIQGLLPLVKKDLAAQLTALDQQLTSLATADFSRIDRRLQAIFGILQEADMAPTTQTVAAEKKTNEDLAAALEKYDQQTAPQVYTLNGLLKKAKQKPLELRWPLAPARIEAPAYIHPAAGESGWEPLFANPALTDANFPTGIWSIVNGELTATEDQCIWSKKIYKDFVLDLEFKNAPGTNSGVIVRCSETDNWIPNSIEIQIADDHATQWANAPANWQCGAIFGRLAASKHNVKKAGAWNRYTITCKGREIWIALNGEMVNYINLNRWVSPTHNPDGSAIPSWLSKPAAN